MLRITYTFIILKSLYLTGQPPYLKWIISVRRQDYFAQKIQTFKVFINLLSNRHDNKNYQNHKYPLELKKPGLIEVPIGVFARSF